MVDLDKREESVREYLERMSKPTPIITISKETGVGYDKILKVARQLELVIQKKEVLLPRYVFVIEPKGKVI